ncbi:hypothetical protein [Desulfuribacillus alkaliarsenatis]|uniref:G domain-containing protein n=1 Tax=Desulfuribacillus alkaliarsenatis TaxID=766136 RepID=A0A1E5FZJ5_9FIRM|nr:hypothetical protein [Desulfuribacillus alkaliarsenatis]OEF96001.1 hypothetical protein BHF68_09640 [Desulfuribacillus alkaliarsenatis]
MELTIIGKKGVGKTLFMLQFAEYIAEENGFDCIYNSDQGVHLRKVSDLGDALSVYNKGIKKQNLPQCVTLYTRGQKKYLKLSEAYSLDDSLQSNNEHRKNTKKTLEKILNSNYLIHIVDSTQLVKKGLDPINYELFQLGKRKKFYIMLLSKTDLTTEMTTFKELKQKLDTYVYPISAKYKEGFFHVYQSVNSVMKEPVLSR